MIFLHPTITSVRWSGPTTLDVQFASSETTRLHQLYVGRRLMAVSTGSSQRVLSASLISARWAEWITVAAADAADAGQDRGSWLPRRPYNRVLAVFDQAAWAGAAHELDVQAFELFRGNTPGGAIDYSQVIDSEVYRSIGVSHELESDPLPGSGVWNLGVRGRDTTVEPGNAGTPDEFTETVLATPPDFDTRFGVTIAAGTATITATIPVD